MTKTHHQPLTALFYVQILKCLLQFFSYTRSVLVNYLLILLLLIYGSYANYNAQEAFVIIFFICSNLLNCLRKMTKTASKSSSQRKSSLQAAIFAVLIYFLYSYPRNLKFTQKYQQLGPCFQTISPFLMTVEKYATIIDGTK